MRKNLKNENQTILHSSRSTETARLNWAHVSSPVFSLSFFSIFQCATLINKAVIQLIFIVYLLIM